jgi:formylglycine-generating enzyme required for sulfatase activity
VRLKSGKLLQGRVVSRDRVQGQTLLKVETDFGTLLVPEASTAAASPDGAGPGAAFHARSVRVARIEGRVERRAADATAWSPLAFEDPYGNRRRPDEIVLPGDTVRTSAKASLDLMLHRDAWVRVAESSEVTISTAGDDTALRLARGKVAQRVQGRPRGGEFRVRTPSTVLAVQGTVFVVRVAEAGESVTTTEGAVTWSGTVDVATGQTARWSEGREPVVTPSTPAEAADVPQQFVRLPLDDLVLVPAGSYRQGGHPAEEVDGGFVTYRKDHERELEEFWIGRTEVSCGDYELFVEATGAKRPAGWAARLSPDAAARPVVGLRPAEAVAYATWAGFGLPREAQWEAAARGPRGNPNPWGRASAKNLRIHRPAGADGLQSVLGPTDDVSPFGCLQMSSNAAERCGDFDNHMVVATMNWEYGTGDDLAIRGGFSVVGRRKDHADGLPVGLRIARTEARRAR